MVFPCTIFDNILSVFGRCTCIFHHFSNMDRFHCFSNRLSPLPHLAESFFFFGGGRGNVILNFFLFLILSEYLMHLHDIQGDAKDSMKALADKKMQFDLIFIDADKENYSVYYKVNELLIFFSLDVKGIHEF